MKLTSQERLIVQNTVGQHRPVNAAQMKACFDLLNLAAFSRTESEAVARAAGAVERMAAINALEEKEFDIPEETLMFLAVVLHAGLAGSQFSGFDMLALVPLMDKLPKPPDQEPAKGSSIARQPGPGTFPTAPPAHKLA